MANDYLKKEPSKSEKMMYELAIGQQHLERNLWSTSTVVMAIALIAKIDPKQVAELMVNGDEQIKEFSIKVNEEIKKLEEAKKASPAEQKPAEEIK
jgi:hypothetical protein